MKIAIIAFVPVLHKGYIDFFSKTEGDIFLFGEQIIDDYVHLTRDLRVIPQENLLSAMKSIFKDRKISILDKSDLSFEGYKKIIMPDDEVCHDFAEKHISNKDIEYVSTFLRWNRIITFKEHEIPAHRKISKDNLDKEFMSMAKSEAQKSSDWWRQIGSVIVKDGKILVQTHNHHLPTDFHLVQNGDPRSNFDAGQHLNIYTSIHSEAEAVSLASKKGISLDGAYIYATTFPCPNCARMLGIAGIKKVFYSKGYSLLDAEKILDHFGVEVVMVED